MIHHRNALYFTVSKNIWNICPLTLGRVRKCASVLYFLSKCRGFLILPVYTKNIESICWKIYWSRVVNQNLLQNLFHGSVNTLLSIFSVARESQQMFSHQRMFQIYTSYLFYKSIILHSFVLAWPDLLTRCENSLNYND